LHAHLEIEFAIFCGPDYILSIILKESMDSSKSSWWSGTRLIATLALIELLFIGIGVLVMGPEAPGLHWAIRWTARFSAVLFLLAFLASSLQRSLHRPWTAALLRERRYIGLGFAVSQLIHLAFIGMAYRWAPSSMGPVDGAFAIGALGYLFTGLMALTSNDAAVRWLGLKSWRLLHSTGMYLLWAIFIGTYILNAKNDRLHLVQAIVFGLALAFKLSVKFSRRKA
jgi:sulfoxide reductase heme-binding subunit YedZ